MSDKTVQLPWAAKMADNLFEWLAPQIAVKRKNARHILAGTGRDGYATARGGRGARVYAGSGGGADRHLDDGTLWTLRETCLDFDRNNPLVGGLLNTACDEIVGPTFEIIPTTADAGWNKAAQLYVEDRMTARRCDWRKTLAFRDMVKLTLRSIWNQGALLHAFVDDNRLQTFEPHEMGSTKSLDASSPKIINGIEVSRSGPHTAYWIRKPDATSFYRGFVGSTDELQRVPADQAIYPAYRKRFNQTAGVPFMANLLELANKFFGYLYSETTAAELSSNVALQIVKEAATPNPGEQFGSVKPNTDDNTKDTFPQLMNMAPGMIFDNRPGEEVKVISNNRPGDTFDPYVVTACRIMGVSVGYPLEIMLKDFSKANFSSIRAALNTAQRSFECWQAFLEEYFCIPWYHRIIAQAIAADILSPREDAFTSWGVSFVWPAWKLLDMQKEMSGHETALRCGIKSRSEIIRDSGRNPEKVFSEIEAENKRFGAVPTAGMAAPQEKFASDDESQEPTEEDTENE